MTQTCKFIAHADRNKTKLRLPLILKVVYGIADMVADFGVLILHLREGRFDVWGVFCFSEKRKRG